MNNNNNQNNFNNFNNMNTNNSTINELNNLNKNQPDINIRPDLYKYPNKINDNMIKMILYVVIALLVIVILFLIFTRPKKTTCPSDDVEFQNKLELSERLNLELGKEMYYKARSVYSDFALGTSLICDPVGTEIMDNVYRKSGNPKFQTYTALSSYVKNTFTGDIVNILLSPNTYKSYSGSLYCVPSSRTRNVYYIDIESITLDTVDPLKLEFTVKEKYFAETESVECIENCSYDYKENKFTIEREDGRWLVSEFTFPY